MQPLITSWFATWLQRVEDEQREWWEAVLGTRWTREDFVGPKDGRRPDVARIPLTLALAQHDFLKEIKKTLGSAAADQPGGIPGDLAGSEVVELGYLDKEDFLAVIGGAGLLPPHLRGDSGKKKKP